MADDIIKNPRRIPYVQKPYEPEYVRHGITPLKAPVGRIIPTPDQDTILGMDTESIDSDGKLENAHMIDNNDYVNFDFEVPVQKKTGQEILSPKIGDFLLLISGKAVMSGTFSEIENRVKLIMYNEDPSFSGEKLSINDMVVLKRVNVKAGIFIDD